jgi:hypothetical protein
MSNCLTNNMIIGLTSIQNNENINYQSNDEECYEVDIKTIIFNAKKDKRFHKLLGLCIKYDIYLFNQFNDVCTLVDINNLLNQCDKKQQHLVKELGINISNLSNKQTSNTWFVDIDNIYIEYKKKFKDIEIIVYLLKNTFNDDLLKELCCVKNTTSNSSSISVSNSKVKKNKITDKNEKTKYIAVYSN